MSEKAKGVILDEVKVEPRDFQKSRHGQYRTHVVAKVFIRSGRLVRYPGETLCGIPAPKKGDGIANPYCQQCLDTGEKHELLQLEELRK